MPIGHYENFPVASLLLPRRLRRPVSVIYRFARSADDLADEGAATVAERLAALQTYRQQLSDIERGKVAAGTRCTVEATSDLFAQLARIIDHYHLDFRHFHDLLSAFSQDVTTTRYQDFDALLDYCRRSANPVGRLMLQLYGADNAENVHCSDNICSALQLVNFWQDVPVDLGKGRIYLPQEDLLHYGVPESDLTDFAGSRVRMRPERQAGWFDLMRFEVDRSRAMLQAGAPLAKRLGGRVGFELRLVVQGGLRILEKIERADYDVFSHRPVLAAGDWPLMAARAFGLRRLRLLR